MPKLHTPINLRDYEVITPEITTKQVETSLRATRAWLLENQATYYATSFELLLQKVLNEEVQLTGSLNSLGRELSIKPPHKAEYQSYNLAEMFRVSVLTKVAGLLQQTSLFDLAVAENITEPTQLRAVYKTRYPFLPQPTWQVIKRALSQVERGVYPGLPKPDGVLSYWATDTHYSKLTRDKQHLYFTVKLQDLGPVTLRFTLPNRERFAGGKPTRPNVYLDKRGRLTFGFTLQVPAPAIMKSNTVLGVDLGLVIPAVGTLIDPTTRQVGAPLIPGGRVRVLSDKLKRLARQQVSTWKKLEINRARGHEAKADLLHVEYLRVRSKISRLKVERSHHVAGYLTRLAVEQGALIAVEDLSWMPNSKWDQARQQKVLEDTATRCGIKIKKVRAAGTSQDCPRCSTKVTHSGRTTYCPQCVKALNRDVLGARNIAARGAGLTMLASFTYCLSLPVLTRAPGPVTPGSSPGTALSTSNTS